MTKNNKIKKTSSFAQFEEGQTSSYEPPKYLVKPAKGDKGFAMFKKAFDDQTKFYQPFIRSTNKDLKDH